MEGDAGMPSTEGSPPPEERHAVLPPGVDLLWGRRERGRRGPRPGLSLDAIVEAAIRLADAEGLEAVAMARVAQLLGFTTMSLYRYVASKDELLQLMWNGSAQGAETLVLHGHDWRSRLRDWALVQRDLMDRHPWITQMPLAAPPVAPNSLTFVERGLEALDGTGLADQDKIRVIGILSSYSLSEARMAHEAARAAQQAKAQAASGEPVPVPDFDGLLRELVDEQHYPRLYRLAWSAGAPDSASPEETERKEFLWGIELILDGVEALIGRAQRSGTAADPS
jgi:AcrR family transcriptional regulator